MADQALKDKIRDVLKQGYFKGVDDLVDVSDGPAGDIHVVVVSRKLDGRRAKDKDGIVSEVLDRVLTPDEWGQVSLTVAVSPEQVKAVY